ncbi:outer membrane beta-barrel protein [Massilia horti]|uniref:Outer membrane protein beta-barrel domain-containing protein n=1 Tax=Massilia horti TaxID=2562153 RepID=A0A4Y9TAJ8_9BURK|nr:outer membrane beta-barrel protein [Massilia horti]TFW35572.1 hypothetical protein E4O92_01920 [Massilia horti]
MFKKIAAAVALSTLAASSFAAPGFYAGADLGLTQIHSENNETSFGGFAGYRFTDNLSAELGYRKLGNWDLGGGIGFKTEQTHLSAVGTLPLSNGFSVFGRLGLNNLHGTATVDKIKVSDNEVKVLYGAGVGYDFGSNVSARVEVQKPFAAFTNVSASVIYSF